MPTLDPAVRDRIDDLLFDAVRDSAVPGVSVAVLDAGIDQTGATYATAVGSRDLAENRPATPQTLYGVGSCTKSFAGLAITQLVEDGDLDFEDSVAEYVDGEVPEDVTLHQLLTHSSGYPSLAVSEALIRRHCDIEESGVPLGDREDFYAHLGNARDERAEPGERFMYSNSGYYLLDHVVEAVDGRSFAAYATDEFLGPLDMDRATFDIETVRDDEDSLTPYLVEEETPEESSLPDRDLGAAPGGLYAPVTELANYLRANLAGGEFEGTTLVSEDGLARAHRGHVETPAGPYGYGWRRSDVLGHEVVGHGGSIAVSTAFLGFVPESNVGVAVGANAAGDVPMSSLGKAVLAALVGEDPYETSFFARRERYDSYVGEYESYRGVRRATVERDGRFLELEFQDGLGGNVTLVPDDPDAADGAFWTLTAGGNREPVEFVETEDGVDLFYERWRLHST
jgi:CubicO group peptidase (beta-lactamase class C family)